VPGSERVTAGTIVIWSDLACPWAHAAVHRLHEARASLGLVDVVRLDHRAFALEEVNRRTTPKRVLDAETVTVGLMEPGAGWQVWQARPEEYPVTTLPAMEAVQAAKCQSLLASEQLDRALRRAMFAESRCISLLHVILDVAACCPDVDDSALREHLAAGTARAQLAEQVRTGPDVAQGSPHVFVAGRDEFNPGVTSHWTGDAGRGLPVVDSDAPEVYRELVLAARP
jgi:predicted DsbA family dithiol-disulfide isomerase